jgi:hypothetical protein
MLNARRLQAQTSQRLEFLKIACGLPQIGIVDWMVMAMVRRSMPSLP